jgi:PEGA domain-containing protein
MITRSWPSTVGIVCAVLAPLACCEPNQTPVGPAIEVRVVDATTGGAPQSDVLVRATLESLPPFQVTIESPQTVGQISGNGPGTYRVQVTAEGYEDWTQSVEVGGRCMNTKMETVQVTLTRRSQL